MDATHPFQVLNFRWYWIARLCTTLAQISMVVILGWQVYDIARATMSIRDASFQLMWIGVAQFLPLLILSLPAGWVADHVDRRWIARTAVALEVGCALTLALLTYTETVTLTALFGVAALLGIARAFAGPALGALAPNLVPKAILPTAIALSALSWQFGTVIAPAMGGYLYAATHWLPYAVSTGLFSLALLMLCLISPVPQPLRTTGNPWAQMAEGLHYVRRNRLVLGAISLDLFAVLLGGATAMLPVYARDILHVGPDGLGHLRAAPALGAVLVGAWFSWRPLKTEVGLKMLLSVGAFGLATVVFGVGAPVTAAILGPEAVQGDWSAAMFVSLTALFVLGAADMVSVYVRQSLIQLYTPDSMRGRVGAVSTLFISGSNELGEAESGLLGWLVGPVIAVAGGGIGAVLVTVLWAKLFPELRRARTFEPPANLEIPPKEMTT